MTIHIHVTPKFDSTVIDNTPPLYRVLHDYELYNGEPRQEVINRGKALPEVFSLLPNQFTSLNRAWQQLWKGINPQMTGREWRQLASCHRAFTNNAGYDCSEGKHGPFVDYVNGRDLGADAPKMEALVCGGALLTGEPDVLYKGVLCLKVKTLDGRENPPLVEWVLSCPWFWFEAVSVRPDGGVQSFGITEHAERVPLVASIFPVYFPMSGLVRI